MVTSTGTLHKLEGLVNKTQDWTYDPATDTYKIGIRRRSPAYVRALVESTIVDPARVELKRLASDVQAGRLHIDEWYSNTLALLTLMHALAATAAHQNVAALLARATLDVQATVQAETGYLRVFRQDVQMAQAVSQSEATKALQAAALTVLGSRWVRRAASYADAAIVTFERHRLYLYELHGYREVRRTMHPEAEHCDGCEHEAAKGWVDIRSFVPLGYEQCGQWCKCSVDYRRGDVPEAWGSIDPELRRTEWTLPV